MFGVTLEQMFHRDKNPLNYLLACNAVILEDIRGTAQPEWDFFSNKLCFFPPKKDKIKSPES